MPAPTVLETFRAQTSALVNAKAYFCVSSCCTDTTGSCNQGQPEKEYYHVSLSRTQPGRFAQRKTLIQGLQQAAAGWCPLKMRLDSLEVCISDQIVLQHCLSHPLIAHPGTTGNLRDVTAAETMCYRLYRSHCMSDMMPLLRQQYIRAPVTCTMCGRCQLPSFCLRRCLSTTVPRELFLLCFQMEVHQPSGI